MTITTRVVHVSSVHPGNDNRIRNKECRALVEAGYDVHLVTRRPAFTSGDGVVVHQVAGAALPRLLRPFVIPLLITYQLARLRPDVIHAHDPELIPWAAWWRRGFRATVIYDAHEDLRLQVLAKPYISSRLKRPAQRLASGLQRLADRQLDAVVAASPEVAESFSRNVRVVSNAPWQADFRVKGRPRDLDAVYVGAITEARGLREMVAATEVAGVRLALAGPVASDELMQVIVGAAHVDYLGNVPVHEIPGILVRARVGLCVVRPVPSYLLACYPTKVMEYMAAGLPFVASDFPRWRHVYESLDVCSWGHVDDITQYAASIREILDSPATWARMSANGLEASASRFSFEAQAKVLVDLVQSASPPAPSD